MSDPTISPFDHARRALSRAAALTALAAGLLTVAWVATMVAFPLSSSGGTADHLRALRESPLEATLGAAIVLPLAFLLVPVWIALGARGWPDHPVAGSLTVAFGLLYLPFATLAYWSQIVVARGLADAYATDPSAAVAAYQLFDFGQRTSLTYAIDVMGYSIVGLAGMSAAVTLWPARGLGRFAGALLAVSGVLSIAGAAGFALRSAPLEVGVAASGVPFLVGVFALAVLLRREPDKARGPRAIRAPAGRCVTG